MKHPAILTTCQGGGKRPPGEIDRAFATMAQLRIGALFIGSDAFFVARREQIAKLALRHAIATISGSRRGAEAGELVSYGGSGDGTTRQAGIYVGRILKGEKPADLPVMQPTKFELVINLKTAKALGGAAVGAMVRGIPIVDGQYAGGPLRVAGAFAGIYRHRSRARLCAARGCLACAEV
jgi:hypothetical protein